MMNVERRLEQLQEFISKGEGSWCWPLQDDLGIKKDGTTTAKFQKVIETLSDEGDESKLKTLMQAYDVNSPEVLTEAIASVSTSDFGHNFIEGKPHKIARKLYKAGLNIYLMGPAGCGKTTFARILAGKGNYVLSSCSSDAKPGILIGHFELVNEETKFIYGPLVRAMKEDKTLILDEADRLNEDVMSKLHEVLESGELLVEATNEMIDAGPNFRIIATGNSDMQGSIEYNTNALDLASIDRFEFVSFDYTDKELRILSDEGLSENDARSLLDITKVIRKGSYSIVPSTRRLISIARMVKVGLSIQEAFEIGYLSRLPEDEAKSIGSLKKNLGQTSKVWTFKKGTPQNILDKVADAMSSNEAQIFKTTGTCLVSDKIAGLESTVKQYLEDIVLDKEGVSQDDFIS